MFQFCNFLVAKLFELSIRFTVGEERLVMKHLLEFESGLHGGFFVGIDGEIDELLPDVTHGLISGMNHVLLIEAIVPEFIEEDFESREVMGVFKSLTNLVHSQ